MSVFYGWVVCQIEGSSISYGVWSLGAYETHISYASFTFDSLCFLGFRTVIHMICLLFFFSSSSSTDVNDFPRKSYERKSILARATRRRCYLCTFSRSLTDCRSQIAHRFSTRTSLREYTTLRSGCSALTHRRFQAHCMNHSPVLWN